MNRKRILDNTLDHRSAGQVLQRAMLRQCVTLTRWADENQVGVTTVHRLVDGTYNTGAGISVELLWRLCLKLSPDVDSARRLAVAYLSALYLIPPDGENELTSEAARLAAEVHALTRRVGARQPSRNRKENPCPSGPAGGASEPDGTGPLPG